MTILNFKSEDDAIAFMSECARFNNQGSKAVIYNWASRVESDFICDDIGENAVWFNCPNDAPDDSGMTLRERLFALGKHLGVTYD